MAKKKVDSALFSAILYIVLGALLAIFRDQMIAWAMTIAGIVFVVVGVLELIKRNWVGGAVSLIIGILIIVLGHVVTEVVLLVLGILLAIKGLVALIDAIKGKKGVLAILFPILTMIIGLFLAFGNGLGILLLIGGILLIVDGVFGLIAALKK